MIIGILLKNYKIYGGVKYIPVTNNHNFIAYIGDNGVGKSSILEALDTYFNGREWNITKGASTTEKHASRKEARQMRALRRRLKF